MPSDSFFTSWIPLTDKTILFHIFLWKRLFRRNFCVACCQGPGRQKSWSMLLRALRAKSVIHVSVGFDSSPPKPLSSNLLKYLGCVSIFRRLFVPSDCILVSFGYTGLLGLRIRAPKPQGLPAPGSCVGQPSSFSAALRRGSAVGLLSGNHSTTSIVCWSAQPVLSFLAAERFRSQFRFFLTCSISPVFEAFNRTLVEEKN